MSVEPPPLEPPTTSELYRSMVRMEQHLLDELHRGSETFVRRGEIELGFRIRDERIDEIDARAAESREFRRQVMVALIVLAVAQLIGLAVYIVGRLP